jgi:hypothetical protein
MTLPSPSLPPPCRSRDIPCLPPSSAATAAAAAPLSPCRRCSDVALIEFIRSLDEKRAPEDRFIVAGDLGDTHLFIKARL